MPTIAELHYELTELRQQCSSQALELTSTSAAKQAAETELSRMQRDGLQGSEEYAEQQALVDELNDQWLSLSQLLSASMASLDAKKAEFTTVAGSDLLSTVPCDVPIMLFPVRLETRFFKPNQQTRELRIRIFPEPLQSDSFDPYLTAEEVSYGQEYWKRVYFSDDEADNIAQLGKLISRFGATRSPWVISVLDPKQVEQPEDVDADSLVFPETGLKPSGWSRPAYYSNLPDRFVAIGYMMSESEEDPGLQEIFTETGEVIPEYLQSSPNPHAEFEGDAEYLPTDPGLKWLSDYEEAKGSGMAITVDLSTDDYLSIKTKGLALLLVVGVRASAPGSEGPAQLERWLTAQQYSDGADLIKPWTATNNTEDTDSGGFTPSTEEIYSTLSRNTQDQEWKEGDGQRLAEAVGVRSDSIRHLQNAFYRGDSHAKAMNTALWTATWGYFLDNMMAQVFKTDHVGQAREHFIDNVRARGAVPLMRFGMRPYGLLPVSTLDGWVPTAETGSKEANNEEASFDLLRALKAVYKLSFPSIPSVGFQGKSNDEQLLEILSMLPASIEWNGRAVYGDDLVDAFWSLYYDLREDHQDGWWAKHEALQESGSPDLDILSFMAVPRLYYCSFAPESFDITQSLVQPAENGPSHQSPNPNYVAYLAQRSPYDSSTTTGENEPIEDTYAGDVSNQPVLYKLLRHAYLQEYVSAAVALRVSEGELATSFNERELLGFGEDSNNLRDWLRKLPEGSFDLDILPDTMWELLDLLHQKGNDRVAQLTEFYEAMEVLQSLSVKELEQLTRETLDLTSHRLDAWITSFAHERLLHLRAKSSNATMLGAYGWVENLRPAEALEEVEDIPEGEDNGTPLFEAVSNDGYLHAPSVNQAAASAVLLSGYLSNSDDLLSGPDSTNDFHLNLGSRQAREAIQLLDGVREGRSLHALLGHKLETALREHSPENLQVFIEPLRTFAPYESVQTEGSETLSLPLVVDGLAVIDGRNDGRLTAYLIAHPANFSSEQRTALYTQITALERSVDAIDDATTAESVYQLVQGNTSRAGATLESIALGEIPPPELTFLDTPRTAITHTYKVLLLFNETPEVDSGWLRTTSYLPEAPADGEVIDVNEVEASSAQSSQSQAAESGSGDSSQSSGSDGTGENGSATSGGGSAGQDASSGASQDSSVSGGSSGGSGSGSSTSGGDSSDGESSPGRADSSGDDQQTEEEKALELITYRTGWRKDFASPPQSADPATYAEPRINAWLSSFLGDPTKIRCYAVFILPTGERIPVVITAADLQLSPLNLLYLVGDGPSFPLELRRIIEYTFWQIRDNSLIPLDSTLEFNPEESENWTDEETTIIEAVETLRTVRHPMFSSHALTAEDVNTSDQPDTSVSDDPELEERVEIIELHLGDLRWALQQLISEPPLVADAYRQILVEATYFGIPGSAPVSAAGEGEADIAALAAQTEVVLKIVESRLALMDNPNLDSIARIKAALGSEAIVLPRFMPANSDELDQVMRSISLVAESQQYTIAEWIMRISKTRPRVAAMYQALSVNEAYLGDPFSDFKVAQLPWVEGDSWLANGVTANNSNRSRTCLVAHVPGTLDMPLGTYSVSGVVIDTWTETVPATQETTGVAFHYDRPSNEAPGSLLFAVAPDVSNPSVAWSRQTLQKILLNTHELAKIRLVDPDVSKQTGQYLPAIYLAENLNSDAASSDFVDENEA